MKKISVFLSAFIAWSFFLNAQIPNNGFENWTTTGGYEDPVGWFTGNISSSGTFYPATKSTDHYPVSIGNYSIRLENHLPLVNGSSYGFAVTGDSNPSGCVPSFPITGHPTKLYGYYKCTPLNNDTIQIGIELFKNGVWIAGGEFLCLNTVTNWTSFNIPISSYTDADSATITVAAFYNDTICNLPYGPYGNSFLYIDNISFDNLITSLPEPASILNSFYFYPNPAADNITIDFTNAKNANSTVSIYTVLGSLISSEKLTRDQQQIETRNLKDGIYMVELMSDGIKNIKRLIIKR